jgi:CBS domain containing-hemolysin-like protein
MRPSRLEELAAQGNRRAKIALGISRRLDAYLSANQFGITLASLALGWIGEDAFARLREPALGRFGDAVRHTVAVTGSFAIMVLQHVAIEPSARKLMDRVFDYSQHLARHVMTLRSDTIVLDADKSFGQNLATVLAQQYTRYPLFDSAKDRVVGYIHIKDIFATVVHGRERYLNKMIRQPIYCFEDPPIEEIRREIQRRGIHLVVVLDPHGSLAGVLTLEDLVEDFMGEIRDEQDAGEIDLAGADRDIETLGGGVMAQCGGVPHVGDVVESSGFRFTVLSMHGRRVLRAGGAPAA